MINKEILGLKDMKLPLLPFSDDLPQRLEATKQENNTRSQTSERGLKQKHYIA